MTDYHDVYAHHADRYDVLVSREDADGNLARMLAEQVPIAGRDVVEMGCGTGRLTRWIASSARTVRAFDNAAAMLACAREKLDIARFPHVQFVQGDNDALPCESGSADVVIAGWTFGHATGWYPDRWRDVIGQALHEAKRVARPGGTVAIIETLGTGQETPEPPRPALGAYYDMLETEYGFRRSWCRTDYRFESVEEAIALTGFFFGEAFAKKIRERPSRSVPECTGLWVCRLSEDRHRWGERAQPAGSEFDP